MHHHKLEFLATTQSEITLVFKYLGMSKTFALDFLQVLKGCALVASKVVERTRLTQRYGRRLDNILPASSSIQNAVLNGNNGAVIQSREPLPGAIFEVQEHPTTTMQPVLETLRDPHAADRHEPSVRVAGDGTDAIPPSKQCSGRGVPNHHQTTGDDATDNDRHGLAPSHKRRERRVPSSSLGRALGFAGLGASLLAGTIADSFRSSKTKSDVNPFITERNAERLASALCRMRGAALKIGQMLSIQDENIIPAPLSQALERVRDKADIMPRRQLEKVLAAELGKDWRSGLLFFDETPLGAASIGQVHKAIRKDQEVVVMKIQYPGVAKSVESDVDNLLRLVSIANILPKGLFIENVARVAKKELSVECDYGWEIQAQQRFRELIMNDDWAKNNFYVPRVYPDLSTERILTSEFVPGVPIDSIASSSDQTLKDSIGTALLKLTLKELFEWRFMQTDPNFANFLYDSPSNKLYLIDFGAAREYPLDFVDNYMDMVRACAEQNSKEIIKKSTELGFLSGDESPVMLDAHVEAGIMVGTPFATPGLYNFGSHGTLTRRVTELGAIMLDKRLVAPPDESYSLHRKLSGAFLACIKLKARVPCNELFYSAYKNAKEKMASTFADMDSVSPSRVIIA